MLNGERVKASQNNAFPDDTYLARFGFLPTGQRRRLSEPTDPETRQRRRRLVFCPTDNDYGDELCTQADLDEFGPDSPGLKALLRRKRRLVYRPIHRLAELILAKLEEDRPPWVAEVSF